MSKADETRDGVALTNLDQPLFDGADATKRDLVDYLDAVRDRHPPAAAGPAAVGDPGPPRPAAVHAEEPAQLHPGLGPHGRRSGRRRRTGRSRTRCATTAARCCGSPTSGRSSTTRRWSPWRTAPPDPPGPRPRPAGGRRRSARRSTPPSWSGRRSPTPAWPARSRPAAPRACTSSCRWTDEPTAEDVGRRHPGDRGPRRAARPGAGHHRVHQGGPRAARCSSTRPGPAARPWSPPTARGCGRACRCRSRSPGTSWTEVTPADFTIRTAPGLLADGDPWADADAGPAAAARRPGRGGPDHPGRPGAGHARGQAPGPRPPRGRLTGSSAPARPVLGPRLGPCSAPARDPARARRAADCRWVVARFRR